MCVLQNFFCAGGHSPWPFCSDSTAPFRVTSQSLIQVAMHGRFGGLCMDFSGDSTWTLGGTLRLLDEARNAFKQSFETEKILCVYPKKYCVCTWFREREAKWDLYRKTIFGCKFWLQFSAHLYWHLVSCNTGKSSQ